jgi:hypothetical protein
MMSLLLGHRGIKKPGDTSGDGVQSLGIPLKGWPFLPSFIISSRTMQSRENQDLKSLETRSQRDPNMSWPRRTQNPVFITIQPAFEFRCGQVRWFDH